MKICPSCGQSLDDDARFCENCGASLASAAPRFCSNCGQKLEADAAFCPNCGTPVREDAPPSQPEEIQPPEPEPVLPFDPEEIQLLEPEFVLPFEPEEIQPPEPPSKPEPPSAPEPAPSAGDAAGFVPLIPAPPATLSSSAPASAPPRAGAFCTNCGERVPEGSTFCPNCHTIIQPQAKSKAAGPQVKAPRLETSRIKALAPKLAGVAAVVVVIIAAAALVSKLFSSPVKTFISVQEELFLSPLLSAMETEMDIYGSGKFSTDMTISASVDSYEIDRYLSGSSVLLKLDANQSTLLANGELTIMGSPVLSGTVTYDKGELGVYLPELDSNYYVMDLSSMLDSMYFSSVDLSDLRMPEFSGKEWRALADTYLDLVYTAVTEDNLTVSKGETFRLTQLGGSYTGTVYTYTPKAEDIEAMLETLADHLEQDKNLRSLILKLVNSNALQEAVSYYYGYADLDSVLDEVLQKVAWQMRSQAAYIGQLVENSGFIWRLYMEGNEVRMVRLEMRANSQMVAMERSGSEAKGCTQLVYSTAYGSTNIYFRNEYTKKGDTYTGELDISGGYGFTATSLRYDADTSKLSVFGIPYGSYDLTVPSENVQCSIEVSAGKSGSTDHVFTVRGSSDMFRRAFNRLELTVNTTSKSSAKKPSKKATDISNYTMWELNELVRSLQNEAQNELYPILYGLW